VTDARLRDVERRWRETGALEDEAAFLRERVRAGVLDDDRLRLAAYVGHAASRLALGTPSFAPAFFQAWIYGLEPWGVEACQRAAIAAARCALVLLRPESRRGRHARVELARAEARVNGLPLPERPPWDPHILDDDPPEREHAAFYALCALGESDRDGPETGAAEAASRAGGVVARAVDALDEATVRFAVRDEVAAWALGST